MPSLFRFILLVCCGVWLSACENPLDLPLNKAVGILTLNAELNPDERINALITLPKEPFKPGPFEVPNNAVVQLFEDGEWKETLRYNPNDSSVAFGIYAGNTRPKAGSRYRIEVNVPGYDAISAEDQVPRFCPIQELSTLYYPADYGQDGTARFSFSISDEPNTDNYYVLYIFYRTLQKGGPEPDAEPFFDFFTRRRSINVPDAAFDYTGGILFSDKTFPGSAFSVQVTLAAEPLSLFADDKYLEAKLFFELRSISRDNYLYRSTLTKFRNDENNGFSEPVLVWNNIKGGLGIFSSFNRDFKDVPLK
jgi:hypothetical protein